MPAPISSCGKPRNPPRKVGFRGQCAAAKSAGLTAGAKMTVPTQLQERVMSFLDASPVFTRASLLRQWT